MLVGCPLVGSKLERVVHLVDQGVLLLVAPQVLVKVVEHLLIVVALVISSLGYRRHHRRAAFPGGVIFGVARLRISEGRALFKKLG